MSWKLIKSIQKKDETDLRLILPFGLNLRLGDVISVGRDGRFTWEGGCRSLLGVSAGKPRSDSRTKLDLMQQSGKKTKFTFRPSGKTSSLFPELPSAQAGFDISFGSSNSWLLAVTGRSMQSLDANRFRQPILDAYQRRVWKPDWALVNSVATVDKMTLLAAETANTQVALSLGAEVDAGDSLEARFTADVSIVATNEQFTKCISTEPMTAFCTAVRVKDGWWQDPYVSTLTAKNMKRVKGATDQAFWEDVDKIVI